MVRQVCAARASSQARRSWAAISCSPVCAESRPQASRKRWLDGRLPGPGTQQAGGLPGLRLASGETAEDLRAQIGRLPAVLGGEEHLDAVAGADIERLGGLQAGAQTLQARRDFRARHGKAGSSSTPAWR